jgi:nicotinate-nucleotide adenylyltransferase
MINTRRKTGLFFGSFNPLHIGHLAIANYFLRFSDLNEIWFVVSPQNPLKNRAGLLDAWLRLDMLHKAVDDYDGFRVSDIELYLPKPSFTSVTLAHLSERNPGHDFALIMGSDNLKTFNKWFNYKQIGEEFPLYVYPRPGYDMIGIPGCNIVPVHAPLIEISSSFIRNAIREGKDMKFFLPLPVYQYIMKEQLYL